MLKWAVNGPRQSYLPTVGESEVLQQKTNHVTSRRSLNSLIDDTIPNAAANAERRRLRRKSSDICSLRRKLRSQDKENQLTSTPLPLTMRGSPASSRKLGSLKDLSNITPDDYCAAASPLKMHTPKRKVSLCNTPETTAQQNSARIPKQYATTLPTFDVEYSPCGLIPGPILALRGIGIADTYFEKPRYITQEFQELNRRVDKSTAATTTASAQPQPLLFEEDSTLSSSKMGDMTLERMIDAILESARKERKVPKCTTKQPAPVMSPTYTPAEDPASDLHEFWDATSEKYHQRHERMTKAAVACGGFNEREVCSPLITCRSKQQQQSDAFQLRRQRAVRRKRRISVITNKVKNSAQKMFALGVLEQQQCRNDLKQCGGSDQVEIKKALRNISPDSGRNSCSDYEDSAVGAGVGVEPNGLNKTSDALDATKRRLSFSTNDLLDECQELG